jgi:hypothetical protein
MDCNILHVRKETKATKMVRSPRSRDTALILDAPDAAKAAIKGD